MVNVKVAVRCRPMNTREKDLGSETTVEILGSQVILRDPERNEPVPFTFDHAYFEESTSQDVYQDIGEPLVGKSLEGYNSTIFAYGQTGSGKTYTMMGDLTQDPGIIPRLNDEIFQRMASAEEAEPGKRFMVMVSYLEIYNEVLSDLLNPAGKSLQIREHPVLGIYVQNLCEIIVKSAPEVMQLIEQGSAVRRVAATKMNAASSRSHSIFQIKIESKKVETEGTTTRDISSKAKINLVDLAGSERASKTGAQGVRLKEGAAINKSLMALGQVIKTLADQQAGGKKGSRQHIPYRDSQLTRLLQESLGGNSATVMVAAISPASDNFEETKSTLQYANRAKSIQNAVTKNEDVNEMMIRKLKDEIDRLKMEIGEASLDGPRVGKDSAELEQRRQMLEDLEKAHKETWEEKERIAAAIKAERQKNVESTISESMEVMRKQKLEVMKEMTNLQQQKDKMEKHRKDLKAKHKELNESLARRQERYEKIHAAFEASEAGPEKEKMEKDLLMLVDAMTKQSQKVTTIAGELKHLKKMIAVTKAEIDEQKKDLMSHKDDLAQNEKVNKMIQEEEENRFEAKKEEYLKKVLEETRAQIENQRQQMRKNFVQEYETEKLQIQKEITLRMEQLASQIDALEEKKKELEEEVDELKEEEENIEQEFVDVDVRKEQFLEEEEELQKQMEVVEAEHSLEAKKYNERIKEIKREVRKKEELAEKVLDTSITLEELGLAMTPALASPGPNGDGTSGHPNSASAAAESKGGSNDNGANGNGGNGNGNGGAHDEDYAMFKIMMEAFEKEQQSMKEQYSSVQSHLSANLESLVTLQMENQRMRKELHDIILWEPDIT